MHEIMGNNAAILKILQMLQAHGVRSTKEAAKDLQNLVQTDIKKFTENFYKDFIIKEFEDYNRYKKLSLTKEQRKRLKGHTLWRYEYRHTSNLRCIFIVYNENNTNIPIILCAFKEDGDKKKGKKSYEDNIERAIKIFERDVKKKNEN